MGGSVGGQWLAPSPLHSWGISSPHSTLCWTGCKKRINETNSSWRRLLSNWNGPFRRVLLPVSIIDHHKQRSNHGSSKSPAIIGPVYLCTALKNGNSPLTSSFSFDSTRMMVYMAGMRPTFPFFRGGVQVFLGCGAERGQDSWWAQQGQDSNSGLCHQAHYGF